MIDKNAVKKMIVGEFDTLSHDEGYYWTYKKSLERFMVIIDMAYELKCINKYAHDELERVAKNEYKKFIY